MNDKRHKISSSSIFSRAPFTSKFSWKEWLWPVEKHELSKLLPLLMIKFCFSFVYTLLFATKDTVIVTSAGSGAEVIPLLKGGVVLIFAFLITLAYAKGSDIFSKKTLFYVSTIPFLVFFGLYGFFLFPNSSWLCPHQTADWLVTVVGESHQHWAAVFRYWMHAAFFVVAELWGSLMIVFLFWSFANQICSVKEAGKFYTLFAAAGNLGVIIASPLIWYCTKVLNHGDYQIAVRDLMVTAMLLTLIIMGLYWWINRYVFDVDQSTVSSYKKKERPSLKESLRTIFQSRSVGLIALMVVGYGLSVNLVEVPWKAALKIRYPDANDYQAYCGIVQGVIGFIAFWLSLLVGGNVLRRLGWYAGAMATPIVLGVCSLSFFGVFLLGYQNGAFISESALMAVVLIGTVHNVACKSMKYCLFDPSKEMSFIPLSDDEKIKGKAAVDLVGSRFGKSGSSWIQMGLIEFVGMGSILNVGAYLIPCVVAAVGGWTYAVKKLNCKNRGPVHKQATIYVDVVVENQTG